MICAQAQVRSHLVKKQQMLLTIFHPAVIIYVVVGHYDFSSAFLK